MLLSVEDIRRLEKEGYLRTFFAMTNSQGYSTLRNVDGCCVFFNPEKRRCKIHAFRPLGCRLYPVILDEAEGIVMDTICPSGNNITEKQRAKRGKKVIELLETIDAEAKRTLR